MYGVFFKDVDYRNIVGRIGINDIRDGVKELEDATWYECKVCGFRYRVSDDIHHKIAYDGRYCQYVKRIVKKSIITHVSSHFIYKDQDKLTLDLGITENDAPVARGEEFYLKTGVRFLEGLNIAILYGLREDANDRILNASYRRDTQSRRYREVTEHCDTLIAKRYEPAETRRLSILRRGNSKSAAAGSTKRKESCKTPCKDAISHRRRFNKVPLKPWQDPESLFCDREFLEKLVGKEIAEGDECRDASKK